MDCLSGRIQYSRERGLGIAALFYDQISKLLWSSGFLFNHPHQMSNNILLGAIKRPTELIFS